MIARLRGFADTISDMTVEFSCVVIGSSGGLNVSANCEVQCSVGLRSVIVGDVVLGLLASWNHPADGCFQMVLRATCGILPPHSSRRQSLSTGGAAAQ